MAFEGGYGGSQRPYAGPAAQPPVPRGGFSGRGPPPRQHNGYQNDYGAGGYEQDYGGQYQDPGYGRGRPPPQGAYGPGPGRGRPPPPPRGGRGGPPMGRPGTADGFHGRGGNYPPRGGMGPPPGRGRPPGPRRGGGGGPPGPNQYPPNIDVAGARHPINSAPVSPQGSNFGDVYQSFQGNQLANQMSAMDLNGQGPRGPPGGGRPGSGGRGIQEDYANPPMSPASRGNSNGYPDPRRGPPGQAVGGYGEYDDGYGPPGHEFGAQRSMTMPFNNGPAGQDVPARPATTTGNRPPPQRTYPPDTQRPPQSYYGGDNYDGNDYDQGSDIYDVYDSYYDDPRASSSDYSSHVRQPSRSSMPDFDAIPLNSKRDSFEQSMRPGAELSQPGAHQTPKLSHAQSMAEMHQPQSAIFEMAGDAPDVPAIPLTQAYQGYDEYDGYDQVPPPRGPSAPPGPVGQPGFGHNPPIIRPGTTVPTNPDSLPAHATPVRPGQMQGSVVNPNVKPPPVRNYGGIPQTGPPGQQQPQPYQNQGSPGPGQQQRGEEPPVTPGELEHLRMLIRNNPDDQTSALQLAKRLIEASDVLLPNLPDPRAKTKARERYLMDAHKILKKLANAQNQDAMFLMADSIGKGLFGADADNKEAFIMYQSAAKLGHAAAAYRTAVCCEIGHEEGGGTRKDPLKAIQWYKRAATLGDPPAMYKVGMILLKGLLGQPKNPREAVGWLKRAAERADTENPHALHELGLLYESAQGNDVIIRDEQYALDLFQQAAELGYKFSQFKLGCAYEYGLLGCPIDARLSIVWYSRAATQEEHQAELALSGWYLTGSEGVLGQSDTEAYLWARKAAVAGLAKAEYAMGYFTEVGIGVPANPEDAKRWYWRAAAQDFPKARDRLEDLKKVGKGGPRQRERISRSRIEKQQEADCKMM